MTEPAEDPSASTKTGEDAPESSGEDEVRRKFREALERKQSKGGGAAVAHGGASNLPAHTAEAGGRRLFRRKSGG